MLPTLRNSQAILVCVLVLVGSLGGSAGAAGSSRVALRPAAPNKHVQGTEAGQFFGLSINFGGRGVGGTTKPSFFPVNVLGSLASAVLGVQPAAVAAAPQAPDPLAPPSPAAVAAPPAAASQQASKSLQTQKPKQQQKQQQQPQKKKEQKQQPAPKRKPDDAKPAKQPTPQQKQQQLPGSSLIRQGPPQQQQQQQQQQQAGKVYYKKKHHVKQQPPKSRQPVVAAAPSYVPASQPGTVPMCEWRSDFGACHVHRHYYLALTDLQPGSSYIAQTITGASARDYACAAHKEPSACQESSQGLRCGWNLSGGRSWDTSGCRSYYMAEWTVFAFLMSAGVGPAQAAGGLTNLGAFSCPGALADRALACNTAYPMDHSGDYDPNLCASAAPGCIFQASTNNCVMSPELTAQLQQLHPEDVGTCSASCYLRSLQSCPKATSKSSPPDPARCRATPGCTWANSACGPDVYSSQVDAWGRKVAAAAEACSRETEAWGCGQAGAKGLMKLPSSAVQAALQRNLPGPGKDNAKCAV